MGNVSLLIFAIIYASVVILSARKIAECTGVMDNPSVQGHKKHLTPTPLVGGLAALPPVFIALLYVFFANGLTDVESAIVFALIISGLGSMLVGFFDDRHHLSAYKRLFISAFIFIIATHISPGLVVSALDFQGFNFHIDLGVWALPFTILCLLSFQNAVNMADGRNGLVTGLSIIWAVSLLSYHEQVLALPLFILIITLILVMIANVSGKIFLGDAGSYGIGAVIGLTSIWIHSQKVGLSTLGVAIMFAFPVCDMVRLIVVRIIDGRHPFGADNGHLHHYIDKALGWPLGLYIYLSAAALPIFLARLGMASPAVGLYLAFLAYIGLFLFCILREIRNRQCS